MYTLSNAFLSVSFSALGAELQSVRNAQGLEYMWQADKAVWPRHAPVLFPIVGKLKNNNYFVNGTGYELPQHGFARDLEFEVINQNDKEVSFELKATESTLKKYPYLFLFKIYYRLTKNTLHISYEISNKGNVQMYYSVGAHPGFNCPLLPSEQFSDYYLLFEKSNFQTTVLQDGLLSNTKQALQLENNKLQLSHALFDNDALVFEGSQINTISICSEKSQHKITIDAANWPYYGIWSKKGSSNFVCLEPWYGIADDFDCSQVLSEKKGILSLAPNESKIHSYSISFF